MLKYAAVILLLVSFSAVGWNYFKPETYMTIALGDSEGVKKVTLDDGSIVWLRGNSVLKIPQSFSAVNRTVSLQGEAFFDIAKECFSLRKHSLTSQRMLIHYYRCYRLCESRGTWNFFSC
ncbi:MAG: hypothetical protein ACLR6J_18785 [Parabacteroides merdae]